MRRKASYNVYLYDQPEIYEKLDEKRDTSLLTGSQRIWTDLERIRVRPNASRFFSNLSAKLVCGHREDQAECVCEVCFPKSIIG